METNRARSTSSKSSQMNSRERERLLLEHLSLVRHVAKSIHARLPQHVCLDDLIQAGVLGLIQAIDKYDSTKNVQLKSYAQFRIRGAILDNLRDLDWSPRSLRAMARRVESAREQLSEKLGRAPDNEEICAELGLELQDYHQLLGKIQNLEVARLPVEAVEHAGDDSVQQEMPDRSGEDPFNVYLQAERRKALAEAMSQLSARERQVLSLYYFEDLTMKEVGQALGVVESRISQIHSATLEALRFCLSAPNSPSMLSPCSSAPVA